MNRTIVSLALAAALMAGAAGARAQSNAVRDAEQSVGLFEQTCLEFAGNAAALRTWIAARKLPPVPESDAKPFLTGGAGRAFGASNSAGRHVLVSYDDGACRVVTQTGDVTTMRTVLATKLQHAGITLTRLVGHANPDGSATLEIYRAAARNRRWELSLTSSEHSDGAFAQPQIELTATTAKPAAKPTKPKHK